MKKIKLKDFKKHPEKYTREQIQSMCANQPLSKKFIWDMRKHLDWFTISLYQDLDEDFIRKAQDYVDWKCLSNWGSHRHFSQEFLHEFRDKIEWKNESRFGIYLDKQFILEHLDYVDLNYLLRNKTVEEDCKRLDIIDRFLKHNPNCFDWKYISQDFTINFIREWKDKITEWKYIIARFATNMDFHKEFYPYYKEEDWVYLSSWMRQFTYDFIMKFEDKWDYSDWNLPMESGPSLSKEDVKKLHKLWKYKQQKEYC